jgi:Major Facilitator Superfamily
LEKFWICFWFILGIGFGGIYLPAIVSVATWFDKKRALAMGIAVCGSGIGIYALANLIPILIEEYGFRGCLLFEGAIVLNALIFASLLRPLPGKKKTLKADRSDRKHSLEMENLDNKHALAIKEAADNSQRGCWQKLLHKIPVFGLWEYWVMLVVVFLCGVSGYIPFTYLTIRAEREAAVARADTALLVTICGITNLLGRLLAGVLSSQPWCNRYFFYSSASIISGITTAFSVYCTTFTAFAIYGGIYGFTGGKIGRRNCFFLIFLWKNESVLLFFFQISTVLSSSFAGVIIALQSVVLSDIVGIERFSGAFGISLFVLGIAALIGTPAAGMTCTFSLLKKNFFFQGNFSFPSRGHRGCSRRRLPPCLYCLRSDYGVWRPGFSSHSSVEIV